MTVGRDFYVTIHMKTDWTQTKEDARLRLHTWLENYGHTTVASGFDLIETMNVAARGKRVTTKKKATKKKMADVLRTLEKIES